MTNISPAPIAPRAAGPMANQRRRELSVAIGQGKPPALQAVGGMGGGPIAPVTLGFARDALMPHISANTMHFHFDKHYLGYLGKVNALIGDTDLAGLSLEEMIRRAAAGRKRGLLANAAQTWNHGFFWHSLSPTRSTQRDSVMEREIIASFGSVEQFRELFVSRGAAHLGSGWLWLSHEAGKGLVLSVTRDATPVWLDGKRTPLLVCDLWEHAYYLDWQNNRAGFLNGFIRELANWDFAGRQLAAAIRRQSGWIYPVNG